MPLVNRLLDAFFRTLDAVDSARERLDRVLGREPAIASSAWDANPDSARADTFAQRPAPAAWPQEKSAPAKPAKGPAAFEDDGSRSKATRKAPAKGEAAKKASAAKGSKKPAGAKKAQKSNRKGSVDRTGADFDSPRARAVLEQLVAKGGPVVAEHAAIDNKKVLARVVWALGAAQDAGSAQGLTAADASALLHLAAGMDVFSTNIARACREETDLIEEGEPDGRIKRYRLTAAGRKAAEALATTPRA